MSRDLISELKQLIKQQNNQIERLEDITRSTTILNYILLFWVIIILVIISFGELTF